MLEQEQQINDRASHDSQTSINESTGTSSALPIVPSIKTSTFSTDQLIVSTLTFQDIDYDILKITAGLADQAAVRAGQHMFVDLFKAFEDFTNSNELTPTLYSNYFVCMNIFANLCEIEEPTWLKRLEKLLFKLLDSNEDEVIRVESNTLGNEINKFDSSTKERFLLVWHESLDILREKQTRLSKVARERDRLNTCYKSLNLWHDRYFSLIEREMKVIQKRDLHPRVKLVDDLRKMQQSIAQKAETVDREMATSILKEWSNKFITTKKKEAKAVAIERKNVWHLHFNIWFQAANEQSVNKHSKIKLMKRLLNCWIDKTRYFNNLVLKVSSNNRQKNLENAMWIWKKRYHHLYYDLNTKVTLFEFNLVLNTFLTWRRKKHDTLLHDKFTYSWSLKQAKIFLDSWKHKTRLSVTASRNWDFQCSNNCFRVWRLNCKASKLVSVRFECQVWSIYRSWYLEQRLLRLQRIHNTRLASNVIMYWKFKREKMYILAKDKNLLLQLQMDTRLVKRHFNTWKTRLAEVKNMVLNAEDILYDNICIEAFSTIFHRFDLVIQNIAEATEMSQNNLLHRYFQAWKHAALQQKKGKLLVQLDQYIFEKTQRLKQTYFDNWTDNLFKKEELVFKASSFYAQRNKTLQQQHWSHWLMRTITITSEMDRVAERDNFNLLTFTFQLWHESKASVDVLEALLANAKPLIARPVFIQNFRIWKLRMFKLKIKQKMASDFQSRLNEFKRKMYWRRWRGRIQRNVARRFSQLSLSSSQGSAASDYSAPDSYIDHESTLQSSIFRTPTRTRTRRIQYLSSHVRTPITPRD